jgi:hypothetical protein
MKSFLIGFFTVLSAVLVFQLNNALKRIVELEDKTVELNQTIKNGLVQLRDYKNQVKLAEEMLLASKQEEARRTTKLPFDPIEGPKPMVSPLARAAWARTKKVAEAPMQGAWELVITGNRIYLDGRLMPSGGFAIDQVKRRKWIFVVNMPDAHMGISRDLVDALNRERPNLAEGGVIHITHEGEEVHRRPSN